jgi:hypothetical protein
MPDIYPVTQTTEQQWETVLRQSPVVSADLNLYRFGFYSHNHYAGIKRAVPVPHPQHAQYSSIEMAKRKQAAHETWWQRKQKENHNKDIQHQKWIRTMSESAFQIHRPNIQNWGNVLKRGY